MAALALLPILVVLVLMVAFRRSSAQAGAAGWAAGLMVAFLAFGLNLQVLWVSQVKGLLLTLNVILLLWPGIFLYNIVDQVGGIKAIAEAFQGMVRNQGWLLVMQAWMLSGLIESLAGFGLPIAMVAPLLISLGVAPITAVASAAVGHSWASSTGGMALSLRLLADITHYPPEQLFPLSAILLGLAMVFSGWAVAFLLKQNGHFWRVLITGVAAAGAHYLAGLLGLIQVSALIAGVVGILVGTALNRAPRTSDLTPKPRPALNAGMLAYGLLALIILIVALIPPLNLALSSVTWTLHFPAVSTLAGYATPAEDGYLFHLFSHPGTLILVTILFTLLIFRRIPGLPLVNLGKALNTTARSGLPATVGTLFMIGLSTTMEHSGMTQALATAMGGLASSSYPLLAPFIGVLGSFATGSNVSSNVLFGVLQEKVARLVGANPLVILAAQTTGGSLGSSVAPAKLALGTSTSNARGHEGEVLRKTLPVCLVLSLIVGAAALLLS
jgi:lactate permease